MHVPTSFVSVSSLRRTAAAIVFALAALFVALPGAVQAQTTVLHQFSNDPNDGAHAVAPLIQGADGNFYGTTARGGNSNNGTVFRLGTDNSFALLYAFDGGNHGGEPVAALVQGTDGYFYGTTQFGGQYNEGTVFRIAPGGTLTTVFSFGGDYGAEPVASLVQGADGYFYGTTQYGGYYEYGTVFQISPDGGTYNVLFDFGGDYGEQPIANLTLGPDGKFYGTTAYGGYNGRGTVFQITTDGTYSVLHDFATIDGIQPQGALALLPGSSTFYGTASTAGTYGYGTAFEITTGGTFTKLHDFNGQNGSRPEGALVYATDGAFYGTTYYGGGGQDNGTVYRLTTQGSFNVSLVLNSTRGQYPAGPVLQIADGTLLGTTYGGGSSDDGTIFQLNLGLPATSTTPPAAGPVPAITSPATATATVGAPFAFGITATNAPASFAASPLPPGTNFDPASGLIAGQIPTAGTYVINLAATNANGTGTGTLTLTVQGPAPVPALVLNAFTPTASYKGGQNGVFAVYLTQATTVDLSVNYSIAGTANNGTDYQTLSGVLVIPAGNTYGLVTVVPTVNLKGEARRTVLIKLEAGSGYTIQTTTRAKVTETFK